MIVTLDPYPETHTPDGTEVSATGLRTRPAEIALRLSIEDLRRLGGPAAIAWPVCLWADQEMRALIAEFGPPCWGVGSDPPVGPGSLSGIMGRASWDPRSITSASLPPPSTPTPAPSLPPSPPMVHADLVHPGRPCGAECFW